MKKIIPLIIVLSVIASLRVASQTMRTRKMSPPLLYNMQAAPRAAAAVPLYDSIYYWTFDTATKGWDVNSKEVKIAYNAADKVGSELVQNWDGMNWVNFTVDTFRYNASNSDTSDIEWAWTGSTWENEYNYTYTYNANDSMVGEVEQIWTGTNWRNYKKYTYQFDANGNRTNLLEGQWNGTAWAFGYQYKDVYNANNLKAVEFDSTGASYNKFIYGYNANNLLTSDTSEVLTGSGWQAEFIYNYTYNAIGLDTNQTIQQWTGSAWINYEKFTYTYDASNNNIGEVFSLWGSSWTRFQQYAYTYDLNNVMLSEEYRQYYQSGNTVILGDSTYWYFNQVSGINELSSGGGQLSIYPNPSKGVFNIQLNTGQLKMDNGKTTIDIYNELGQQVLHEFYTANYPVLIDLGNQPNGIYFIRLENGKDVMERKIIVQK